jgi:methyl-accepting chemotaxis protein
MMFGFQSKTNDAGSISSLHLISLFRQMVAPTFALDVDGRVIVWNDACAALTGVAASEVMGTRDHWRALYRDARPCLADLVLTATQPAQAAYANLNVKNGVGRAENWCDLPVGKRCYLAFEAFAVRDGIGKVIGVVEFLHDLTAAEEARLALEADRIATSQAQAQIVACLAAGLQELANGNLTAQIDEGVAPDFEQLRSDFNQAIVRLQDAMASISGRSRNLQAGGADIARATNDLSRRTEQQAASLEKTAAALDEITATVKKTAQGAIEARKMVGLAKAQAQQSDVVVKEAVSAMSEIESSSRQISQIIGVIDEIAFQTNLLALNAGVEAARAGDAGRGFAVVASEVRALAQRSAEAAKQIKTLISASTQQVSQGVNRVGETGKAIMHIADQVTRIEGVVVEIAASAQEQAMGLNDVNAAVNQMDQVTQQNAAMVEETTTVSHKLSDESEALAHLVAAFQLGDVTTTQSAAPSPVSPRTTRAPAPARRHVASAGGAASALAIGAQADGGWDEF